MRISSKQRNIEAEGHGFFIIVSELDSGAQVMLLPGLGKRRIGLAFVVRSSDFGNSKRGAAAVRRQYRKKRFRRHWVVASIRSCESLEASDTSEHATLGNKTL